MMFTMDGILFYCRTPHRITCCLQAALERIAALTHQLIIGSKLAKISVGESDGGDTQRVTLSKSGRQTGNPQSVFERSV